MFDRLSKMTILMQEDWLSAGRCETLFHAPLDQFKVVYIHCDLQISKLISNIWDQWT